jgi:hypothetical protein
MGDLEGGSIKELVAYADFDWAGEGGEEGRPA